MACLHRRIIAGVFLIAAACWSKESAVVFPVLAALAWRARDPQVRWSAIGKHVAPLAAVVPFYLGVRTLVLRGAGGSGDMAAPLAGKLLQIGAGLLQTIFGSEVTSSTFGWVMGAGAWMILLIAAALAFWRRGGGRSHQPTNRWALGAPLLWVVVSVVPLLAAPWIVGARYFYLAVVGLVWLVAELMGSVSLVIAVGICAALGGLAFAQAGARRGDVLSYQARLSAARRAVANGLAQGYTTFHVVSGIKDLDLAVKLATDPTDRQVGGDDSPLVVLTDVPASFVVLPESRAVELDFLVARPALPPSGGYRFGARRIVGLARRGDDPTIDEVMARLPAIRFIRLRSAAGDRVIWRDVTESLKAGDAEDSAGD